MLIIRCFLFCFDQRSKRPLRARPWRVSQACACSSHRGTAAQSKNKNNKQSGGLPHSEIAGSKPILSSPALIAEYHVLHRLLLPRHPPNALFALDLIQKKPGFFLPPRLLYRPLKGQSGGVEINVMFSRAAITGSEIAAHVGLIPCGIKTYG